MSRIDVNPNVLKLSSRQTKESTKSHDSQNNGGFILGEIYQNATP